jgi:hypothetical protein
MRRVSRLSIAAAVAGSIVAGAAGPAGAHSPAVTHMRFKLETHEVVAGDGPSGMVKLFVGHGRNRAALSGAPVDFLVDGQQVGEVFTDSDGVAALPFTPAAEGDHVVKAVYRGDDSHKRVRRAQGFTAVADGASSEAE